MVRKVITFMSMDLTEPNCKDFVASDYRGFAAFERKDLIALAFLLVLPYPVAFLLVLPYLVAFLLILPYLEAFLNFPYLAIMVFPHPAIMVFLFQDSSLVTTNE